MTLKKTRLCNASNQTKTLEKKTLNDLHSTSEKIKRIKNQNQRKNEKNNQRKLHFLVYGMADSNPESMKRNP